MRGRGTRRTGGTPRDCLLGRRQSISDKSTRGRTSRVSMIPDGLPGTSTRSRRVRRRAGKAKARPAAAGRVKTPVTLNLDTRPPQPKSPEIHELNATGGTGCSRWACSRPVDTTEERVPTRTRSISSAVPDFPRRPTRRSVSQVVRCTKCCARTDRLVVAVGKSGPAEADRSVRVATLLAVSVELGRLRPTLNSPVLSAA